MDHFSCLWDHKPTKNATSFKTLKAKKVFEVYLTAMVTCYILILATMVNLQTIIFTWCFCKASNNFILPWQCAFPKWHNRRTSMKAYPACPWKMASGNTYIVLAIYTGSNATEVISFQLTLKKIKVGEVHFLGTSMLLDVQYMHFILSWLQKTLFPNQIHVKDMGSSLTFTKMCMLYGPSTQPIYQLSKQLIIIHKRLYWIMNHRNWQCLSMMISKRQENGQLCTSRKRNR